MESVQEKGREKDVWERHGLERGLGGKIINGYVYVGASLLIFGLFLFPVVLVLAPITLLADWLFPIAFPYNLLFQIPISIYVISLVWKWTEEKEV